MLRLASLIRSAISRRTPITLISEVCAAADTAAGTAAVGTGTAWASDTAAAGRAARRDQIAAQNAAARVPNPQRCSRSMPASRARRRLAGEAMIRPARSAAAGAGAAALMAAGAGARRRRRAATTCRACGCAGARGIGLEHDQRRTHRHLVARRTGDRQHTSADRRGHLHGRLVGHHLDDDLILGDDGTGLACARRRSPPRRCPRPGPAS